MNTIFTQKASGLSQALNKSLKTITIALLGGVFGVGMMAGAADAPAFNNTANDYSTIMVAKTGAAWSTSTTAAAGDTINVLIWDHNSVPNTVANNVIVKAQLNQALASNHILTGSVSADNAATVTGTANINVGTETKLTYVAGSAKLYKNNNNQMTLVNWPTNVTPDNVVTTGVNLGNQAGCWQFAQAVSIQVRIEGVNAAINTNKRVELSAGQPVFDITANAQPGDIINYKVFLQNTGSGTGMHPKIVDTLDSHLTYVPNSSYMLIKQNNSDFRVDLLDSLINFQGQKITWAFADMGNTPDKAIYLIFQAKVAPTASFAVGTTVLHNVATSSFDNASVVTNDTTVNIVRNPEPVITFSLRKEITNLSLGNSIWYDQRLASAGPGDEVAYRLIVQNTGNTTATNVTLKDVLPAGVSFAGNVKLYNKDNINGKVISGNDIITNGIIFPSVENGNANIQTIIFQGKLSSDCSGQQTVVNNAQVILGGVVMAHDDATAVFSCVRGLIITKDILDPADNTFKDSITSVRESQTLTYRILVQNNGNVNVTTPVLRDLLPEQVSYVNNSLSIDAEFMTSTIQQAFLNQGIVLTNLNPGLGKTIIFQVKVNDCPPFGDIALVNTALVKADGLSEISDTASTMVKVTKPTLW